MNKRKVLLAIIIIFVLILICILILMNRLNKSEKETNETPPKEIILEEEFISVLQNVTNRNDYYCIKNCVEKFYSYYSVLHEDNLYSINLYNMLDKEYINFKGITQENIIFQLPQIEKSKVNITNMYVSKQTTQFSVYIVEGTLRNYESLENSNFKVMVKIDTVNGTFSILLQDYIDNKYADLRVGNNFVIKELSNIEVNNDNKYYYNYVYEATYVNDVFDKYKEEFLYNTELVYYNLDEEYRKARFGTLENFMQYAQGNVIEELDKYKKVTENGKTQYICIDKNGTYYIFNENAIMDFDIILDTYTIDLPEFIEKYNFANEQQKVALNIDKFFQALDDKNYKYAYSCLADSYKNNYFKTQEEFEIYARENFYENSKVEFNKFNIEGQVYTYSVILTNKATGEQMNKTFIMQLGEGTEFVLSFDK